MQNDVRVRKRSIKNQVQVLLIKYLLDFWKPIAVLTSIFNPPQLRLFLKYEGTNKTTPHMFSNILIYNLSC